MKTYIPKKDREVAEKLAIKKYLTLKLEALNQEQTAIQFYLRHHSQDSGKAEDLLREHAGYRELLEPYFKSESWRLAEWANDEYDKNASYPEHLIHKTSAGILVRSKSEAMIVHALYTNQIPFRYECALHLASTTLYPDFTIRHPKTGETFYWEHFGMMGDPDYSQKAFSRMQLYNSNGIIPSIQLITTFETLAYPLNHETIEKTFVGVTHLLTKFYVLSSFAYVLKWPMNQGVSMERNCFYSYPFLESFSLIACSLVPEIRVFFYINPLD